MHIHRHNSNPFEGDQFVATLGVPPARPIATDLPRYTVHNGAVSLLKCQSERKIVPSLVSTFDST